MHTTNCPNCGRAWKFADAHNGKKAKCGACQFVFRLQVASESRDDTIASNRTVTWQIGTGLLAAREAIARNIKNERDVFDAVELIASPLCQDRFHALGRLRCHVCKNVYQFDREFRVAKLAGSRLTCPNCSYEVDLLICENDNVIFLIASRGTQPPEVRFFDEVKIWVDNVDGRPPTPYAAAEKIPALLRELDNPSYGRNRDAGQELLGIGQLAIEALVCVIKGERKECRPDTALGVLVKMGPQVVPVLHNLLSAGNSDRIIELAAEGLRKCGDAGKSILIQELRSSKARVRYHAASSLRYGADPLPDAVLILMECLRDESDEVKEAAAATLGRIATTGGDVSGAFPTLIDLLASGKGVFAFAVCDMGSVNPTMAANALLAAVEDGTKFAHDALTKAHYLGNSALPVFRHGLLHDSAGVRHAAVCAIADILKHNSSDFPSDLESALRHGLSDSNDCVRFLSSRSLELIVR